MKEDEEHQGDSLISSGVASIAKCRMLTWRNRGGSPKRRMSRKQCKPQLVQATISIDTVVQVLFSTVV